MNFNIGGISDNLKYSYQQFCKQDAEARERSRQLLIRLHKFEAKSMELASRTKIAQQMKDQFERTLMQQNPLLWAQIQRAVVTDHLEFEMQLPEHHYELPFGTKPTREVAVSTADKSSSSISEQQSLREDGVWPQTPSPLPHQLTELPPNIDHPIPQPTSGRHINSSFRHTTERAVMEGPIVSPPKNFPASTPDVPLSPPVKKLTNGFSPAVSSTPNRVVLVKNASFTQPHESIHGTSAPQPSSSQSINMSSRDLVESLPPAIAEDVQTKSSALETGIQDAAGIASRQPGEIVKPFRLESESESADEAISGPISGQKVDDDSDSFWN